LTRVKNRPADFFDRIERGQIYCHIMHDFDFRKVDLAEQWKLCIPREDRTIVLGKQHDNPTAGHFGMAKTIARMARLYYWSGMFQDITGYVRRCPTCLTYKVSSMKPVGNLYTTPITAP